MARPLTFAGAALEGLCSLAGEEYLSQLITGGAGHRITVLVKRNIPKGHLEAGPA